MIRLPHQHTQSSNLQQICSPLQSQRRINLASTNEYKFHFHWKSNYLLLKKLGYKKKRWKPAASVVRVPGYRSEFDSRSYKIFWEVVGLERGPLSLVSTTEELLGRKSSRSGLETGDYGRWDLRRWPRDTPLYPRKLALTSPTSGGRSVGIVHSRTKATELLLLLDGSHSCSN
jgi:hypothetical protein